jgi:hypothetical protein
LAILKEKRYQGQKIKNSSVDEAMEDNNMDVGSVIKSKTVSKDDMIVALALIN